MAKQTPKKITAGAMTIVASTSAVNIVNPFIKSQKVGVEPTLIVLETTVLP